MKLEGKHKLIPIVVMCKDCNNCDNGFTIDYFDANVRFECVQCNSKNTETRLKELN